MYGFSESIYALLFPINTTKPSLAQQSNPFKMLSTIFTTAFVVPALALPFMGLDAIPNGAVEVKAIRRQLLGGNQNKGSCPYNDPANHIPAGDVTDEFPYLGAKGTLQRGTGKGGVQVPMPGDTAHMFIAPK